MRTRTELRPAPAGTRRAFAMVIVLLTLLALLVLSTPFLLSVTRADRASARLADRTHARVALDAAARHALARLSASHPTVDRTPGYDSLDEVAVRNDFPEGFLAPQGTGPQGSVLWDLEVEDVAGRIDLNSAPPQVFGNLFGQVTRLAKSVEAEHEELSLIDPEGLDPLGGFVWVESELIGYRGLDGSRLTGLVRGLGTIGTEDGSVAPCGPRPAGPHPVGATVLDQRALALPLWRLLGGGEGFRTFEALEDVRRAETLSMTGSLGEDVLAVLERTASVFGGVRAGQRWQHGTRLVEHVHAGPEGCILQLEDTRWFNAGTTVEISDGERTEFGIVLQANRARVTLRDPLTTDFDAYETVVRPLARRPVNVNTAPGEVLLALVENLQLRGATSRITRAKARTLVSVIEESRPFDGFEDFLLRVVLPAAGLDRLPVGSPVPAAFEAQSSVTDGQLAGFLEQEDAVALYKNALNANDNELGFSTMPFSFTSRDVYGLSLRASINAASGVERASLARDEVRLVAPQEPGFQVWARQEDLDLALRLDREAPGWVTGPEVTSRVDEAFESDPPTRARAHLGPYDTRPSVDPTADEDDPGTEHVFASRDPDRGWAQPGVVRADEEGERRGRVLHFDDEREHLEGRFLPSRPVIEPVDRRPRWLDDGLLMKPIQWEAWIEPRSGNLTGGLLDVSGALFDADRVTLLFDEEGLVLRVLDGAGDNTLTEFHEVSEIRHDYAAVGDLPPDVWSHVAIEVRGNKPDQMDLWIDGKRVGERTGLTYLASAISSDSTTIPVESTEGFPQRCALRIGAEIIEAEIASETSFTASPDGAGFGGRLARQSMRVVNGLLVHEDALTIDGDHPQGAAVELYGYSVPFADEIAPRGTRLSSPVGRFRVARVAGTLQGGDERFETQMEPVDGTTLEDLSDPTAGVVTLGWGVRALGSQVSGLVLAEVVEGGGDASFMEAFDPDGGYVLLVQRERGSVDGISIGGVEIVEYAGVSGTHLTGVRRAPVLGGEGAALPDEAVGMEPRNFLVHWNVDVDYDPPLAVDTFNGDLSEQVLVVPLSLALEDAVTMPPPHLELGQSEIAQITRSDDAAQTEWVRYDLIEGNRLVRMDPFALSEARKAALAGLVADPDPYSAVPGSSRPRGGGGFGGIDGRPSLLEPPATIRSRPVTQTGRDIAFWSQDAGLPDPDEDPVTRAVRSVLQFRGVMGTYPRDHPNETLVLPVVKMAEDRELERGLPGRLDAVKLLTDDTSGPGLENKVHRSHRLGDHFVYSWRPGGAPLSAQEDAVASLEERTGLKNGVVYVGLELQAGIGAPAGDPDAWIQNPEIRTVPRLVAFPSGERPRAVDTVVLGGSASVDDPLPVPDVLIDEAVFLNHVFAEGTPAWAGAALLLGQDLLPTGGQVQLLTYRGDVVARPAYGQVVSKSQDPLPRQVGLLRIGEEILCYEGFAGTDALALPAPGRGLLGTTAEAHAAHEPVHWLEEWRVGTLLAPISAEANVLTIFPDTRGFPTEGTVLVDRELIHFTRHIQGGLWMPRASKVPGAHDGEGRGLFRGRFGTEPAAHEAGTPVIVFPYRYRDGFAENADAPELDYFQFTLDQPGAFWLSAFWKAEETPLGGPRLDCLLRTSADAPWDGVPGVEDGLVLLHDGMPAGLGNPLGAQADRVEARIYVEYAAGSWDPVQGAHGWKQAPRLQLFGLEYLGPNTTLRRVER